MVVPELSRVWTIRLPVPPAKPLTLGDEADAVQEKVVPATCERFWMPVFCSGQSVCVAGLK